MPTPFEEAVLAYKYCSPNLSILEIIILNSFWEKFVYVYPTWLAPNIISMLGFAATVVMYALSWYASPEGQCAATPQYLYCLFGFLLFAYQTLDGTDGKQARRTKSGSALGELTDHGIDAVVTGFVAVVVADALCFDLDANVMWICVIGGQMTFFMSNLTLLHRGKQTFFPIDIMELQWVMICSLILSGLFGPKIWIDTLLPVPSVVAPFTDYIGRELFQMPNVPLGFIQMRFIVAFGAVAGTIQNFILYAYMSSTPYWLPGSVHPASKAVGRGILELFRQILIIFAFGGLAFSAKQGASQIKDNKLRCDCIRALLFGLCFAFGDLMDRLLIMRVALQKLPTLSPTLGCTALFAIALHSSVLDEQKKVYACIAAAGLTYVCHNFFLIRIAKKLAKVLGISVFTIKDMNKVA